MSTSGTPDDNGLLHPRFIAAQAHRLDARLLLAALPHLDHVDLFTVRSEFSRWAAGTGRGWPSWQDAWNAWASAQRHAPGAVRFTPARCVRCHGRRFDRRTFTACMECHGTGRGRRTTTQTAMWIEPPRNP